MAVLFKNDERIECLFSRAPSNKQIKCLLSLCAAHSINKKHVGILASPGKFHQLESSNDPPSMDFLTATTTNENSSPAVLNLSQCRLVVKALALVLHCLGLHLLFVHCVTSSKFLNLPVPPVSSGNRYQPS